MNKEIFLHIVKNLEASIGTYVSWRYAGSLEMMLIQDKVINPNIRFNFKKGGKKYFPYILDFRWEETYPKYILRISKEYIQNGFVKNNVD